MTQMTKRARSCCSSYDSRDALRMAALAGVELSENTIDEHVVIAPLSA